MGKHDSISAKLTTERQAKIFNALSDPTRLRIIEALRSVEGEMTGTEIVEKAKISGLALLCHHWKILEEAGLIARRREGQSVYCSLNRDLLDQSLRNLMG